MGGGDTSGRTSRVSGPTLVLGGMDRGSSREVGPAGAAHGVPLAHDTRGQPRPTDAVSARLDRLYGSQADGATPRLLSTLPTLAMCALIIDRNMLLENGRRHVTFSSGVDSSPLSGDGLLVAASLGRQFELAGEPAAS
jgi:hypothetical protein